METKDRMDKRLSNDVVQSQMLGEGVAPHSWPARARPSIREERELLQMIGSRAFRKKRPDRKRALPPYPIRLCTVRSADGRRYATPNPPRRLKFSGQGNAKTWGSDIECKPRSLTSLFESRSASAWDAGLDFRPPQPTGWNGRSRKGGLVTDCSAEPTSERPADGMGECRLMAEWR